MQTQGVVVTKSYANIVHAKAYLLVDTDIPGSWESIINRALTRCQDLDVDWLVYPGLPPEGFAFYSAAIDRSLAGQELIELLVRSRDHLGGLDDDERAWLDDVIAQTGVSDREIRRFKARALRGYVSPSVGVEPPAVS